MDSTRRSRVGATAAVAMFIVSICTTAATAAPARAPATGGYPDQSETQSGPTLLHKPPPPAPQLENTGIWHGEPNLICGTSAYRAGEYVNQGCIYDDQGGGTRYPYPTTSVARNYTYPTDPIYRGNVADILGVRAKPLPDATAFRITYNSMTDPNLVGTTLALGSSAAPKQAPHGANTVMPAEKFVTAHGSTGDIVNAADGQALPERPTVVVDKKRRQVEIRVPHSAFNPDGQHNVRLAAASGLWDNQANHYLTPQSLPDRTHPGGAVAGDPSPSAFFDSAFRFDEPMKCPWRNCQQLQAIANGDISPFFATVDFTKLAAKINDDMHDQRTGIPTHGYMDRIYPTHTELAQGRRQPGDPGGPPTGTLTTSGDGVTVTKDDKLTRPSPQFGWVCRDHCVPALPGRLQRYVVYVPKAPAPPAGYGSMFFLPGGGEVANDQIAGDSDLFHQVAERPGRPSIVVDPDRRGSAEWYYGQSGSSVFDAMADARRHYHLDTTKTVLGGFSGGAYGANKLSLQFPGVFSRVFVCDGLNEAPSLPGLNGVADKLPLDTLTKHEPGSELTPLLPNRRNQPVMEWAGANDDFVPYNITRERANAYAKSQQDYEFTTWAGPASEHLTMCHNGMWNTMTRWLGNMQRSKDPFHVTYVRNPLMDDPASGLVGNKAYWLSQIQSRDGQPGTIDTISRGYGLEDPAPAGKKTTAGVSEGTLSPGNPYTREFRHPGAPKPGPRANVIDISSSNIKAVTINPQQAKVDCNARITVTGDGPVTVRMLGCGPVRTITPRKS